MISPELKTAAPSEERAQNAPGKGCGAGQNKTYLIAKRALDIVLSVIGLIVAAIPMLLISICIRLESPGPAIYIHNRVGKNGKPLPLLKFRSMYMDADKMIETFTPEQRAEWDTNFKLECDPRVTRVGDFLRKSSLDELPQLVNILRGELSVVGPRPVVPKELEKYGENAEKFLSVTPGLTGYWQAYARNSCTYDRRMEMELYYVENASFWWDIRIMFATIGTVISKQGAM